MGAAEHQNLTGFDTQDLDALIKLQRSKFRAEGEVTYATRIDRLKRLKALILENKVEFANTTKREFNGARSYEFSLFSEFGSKVEAIDYSIKHLKEWMKPEKRKTNKPMNFLGGKRSGQALSKRCCWHHFSLEPPLRLNRSPFDQCASGW